MLAAGVGGLAGLAAGAVLTQRAHLRRIAADPANQRLSAPPGGRPLSARSADGTALHIECFGVEGADSAPTVVLAHGWTEQLAYWTLVIEQLTARGFRVAAYDLRGHGHSEAAAGGDYSLTRFGEDLEAVLTAVCPSGERALVAGHSLGAMSIVAWAEDHDVTERVSAAALLNTGVGSLLSESLIVPVPWIANALNRTPLARGMLTARGSVPKFSTPISSALVRYTAFGPSATPAQVAFYERMLVACPPDVRASVGLALSELDLYRAVPRLTVPTLVMAGADDRLTPPAHAERIAAELPALERLIVLPETGHMGPIERPREIAEALIDLAARAAEPASQTTA
jgi:pimeloyl-ACP methyl ester carboxylesterase